MGRIAGIFPVGTTGEEFVVAEWVPDPDIIANQLLSLANATEDWAEPLAEAREAFIYSTELHFETESDPYGDKWTPLDEEYLKYKLAQGYPENILERTGALKRAATSQEAWMITERDIIFRSDVLPNYGPLHQAGSISAEAQGVVNKLRRGEELNRQDVKIATTGFGRGMSLPQRMFIGADEDTIAEIEAIFLRWLDMLVEQNVGGGGYIYPPEVGDQVYYTSKIGGGYGALTNLPAFGGGSIVRGAGGKFVGVFRNR